MTVSVLEKVSKELNIDKDKLMIEGIRTYLEKEIRLSIEDIDLIKERYSVKTMGELEIKIKEKKIPGHPAWEDLIQWENIDNSIVRLNSLLKSL